MTATNQRPELKNLQQLLRTQYGRDVSYEEACDVGTSLIQFLEVLSED